jgi:hypothetical protein
MSLQEWSKKVIKELIKHADHDNCQNCKQLIAEVAAVSDIKLKEFKKQNN